MKHKLYQCPNHEISEYVETLLKLKDDDDLNIVLKKAKEAGTPAIQISHSDARHLEVLAKLVKPKKILEFGTLCGYSAVALSRSLGKDGVLYTCEKSHHHAAIAAQNFKDLKLNHKIILVEGNALEKLEKLEQTGPYDIIFLDAKKEDYPNLFEWCVVNLNQGGLLLADNVFALGHIHVTDASSLNENLKNIVMGMRKFNELCANDKRLSTTILPTGEGLLAAVKL